MPTSISPEPTQFSSNELWRKLRRYRSQVPQALSEKVLWLYYTLRKPELPKWARTTVVGALVYFIWPFDAVPDFIPVAGFSDDLAMLAAAIATVAMYIDDEVRGRAASTLAAWRQEDASDLGSETSTTIDH